MFCHIKLEVRILIPKPVMVYDPCLAPKPLDQETQVREVKQCERQG
jgi:hypothetical protein